MDREEAVQDLSRQKQHARHIGDPLSSSRILGFPLCLAGPRPLEAQRPNR